MNRTMKKHLILSLVLVIALIAAMALSLVSCDKETVAETQDANTVSDVAVETVVGTGDTSFNFKAKLKDGTVKSYIVKTDKTTVGDALVEVGLISGSNDQYGLMVDTVCGETLIYENDKMYWAFYQDGKYANAGVDSTEIDTNVVYSFEATPA